MKVHLVAVYPVMVLSLICVATSGAKPHSHHPFGKYSTNQMKTNHGWTPLSRNDIFGPQLRVKADIENKMRSVANKD